MKRVPTSSSAFQRLVNLTIGDAQTLAMPTRVWRWFTASLGLLFFSATATAQLPTLGAYPNTSVAAGQNTAVTPGTAPTNTVRATASTHTNFTGLLAVNPTTGAVSVTDAKQAGVYTVTVTAFGGTGSTATATFTLTVTDPACSVVNFRGNFLRVGDSPRSVAIGDFNGDGKQDLATANWGSNNVSILLGNGDGTFSGSTNIPVGDRPEFVAIGDFNGDGRPDFATANFNSDDVSIRLGDGLGGFSGATNVAVGDRPYSVAIGDFNGDGNPDLATANWGSSNVSILLGNGDGTFSGATNFGVSTEPNSVAIGDFNGDGKQDLATADNNSGNPSSDNVSILIGNGDGTFSSATAVRAGTQPGSIAIGDFDGDGRQDLAVSNRVSDDVSILLGNGDGTFSSATNIPVGNFPRSVAIGDFNGDGRQDLVSLRSNNASILLGDGLGGFGSATNVSVSDLQSVAIGDFDGDGRQDLVSLRSNNASILLGDGMGGFIGITTVPVGAVPESVAIGDFNGDGRQDFATANRSSDNVSIRLGDGMGRFSVTPNVAVGEVPASVAIGDFNGDGRQDLAAANRRSNNVSILLGDGMGGFSSTTTVGVNGPESVAIGDFNGDGRQDLATANQSSDNVSILLGDGMGGFGSATNMAVGGFPEKLAIGDFNRDGKQDLVTANVGSDNVSILLGDGLGGFSGATNVAVGDSPQSVEIGDFNRDGWQDLAVANSGSDNVSILLGDGMGGFGSATNVAVGDRPYPVVIGDFNGDGLQDLAVGNDGSYNVSILLGDGMGSFSGATTVEIGSDIESIAMGDFNGDGLQDFVAVGHRYGAAIRLGVASEINLKGNGMDITDGDNSPSTTDHTDFGQTTGASITRTFTIQNTGNLNLSLGAGAITLSGGDAALFSVGNVSPPTTIAGPNGTLTFEVTYTPGANFQAHTATVHIASDDCNEADYDFAIKGELICTMPSFTACPNAPVTVNAAAGLCNAPLTYTVSAIGAPAPTLAYTFTGATTGSGTGTGSGSTFEKGNTMVTVAATNTCGTVTCTFTVAINDAQAPSITCPANIVRSNGTGACGAVVTYAPATATDNCGAPTVAQASAPLVSGSTFPLGVSSVTFRATDAAGNSTTCAFTVTVNDAQAPTLTCPPNQVRTTATGTCAASATYTATASDNCTANPILSYSFSGATTVAPWAAGTGSGSNFIKGITTVALRAVDGAGLTRTCTFRIIVNDGEAPTLLNCNSPAPVNAAANTCSAVVTYATPTFTDNCAPTSGTAVRISGPVSGTTISVGNSNVIFQATDASGKTGRCTITLTVVDNQAPVVTCPPSVTVQGEGTPCTKQVFYTAPTATDNCDGTLTAFLFSGWSSGSIFPAGVTTNTWRALASNGQTGECAFTVTVNCAANKPLSSPGMAQPANLAAQLDGGLALTLAPNPSRDYVVFALTGMDTNGDLLAFDALGRLMVQQAVAVGQEQCRLDVSNWPQGTYRICVKTDRALVTKTLVVQKD